MEWILSAVCRGIPSGVLWEDFENGLHFDCCTRGKLRETESAACVEAVAVLAEDLVQQVRTPVNDEMLLGKFARGVYATENSHHSKAVERPVCVPDGIEHLLCAISSSGVPGVRCEVGPQLALQIAHMAGGEQLLAGADAKVQIARGLLTKGDSQ